MSRQSNLAKNTIIYFIGSFGSKILTFILLPLYANYLTKENYGSYDLINTIILIAYPAVTLMLDNSLYVFLINSKDKQERADIISFSVHTLIRDSIIAIVIVLIVDFFIYPIQYVLWTITWLISFSAYNMWSAMARGFGKQKLFSITGIIVTAITLTGNIIGLVILKQDYKSLMIANSLAYSAAFIFLECKLHAYSYTKAGKVSKQLKSELLKYTIPLLPNQLSWWILSTSDRLMITYYLGTASNGIYAMACKIPAVLNMIHSIYSLSFSDDILTSENLNSPETVAYANRIYNMYIRAMIGVSILLMAANKIIFTVFIGGNFVEAYHYTYLLYVGFVFSCIGSLLGAFYGYYKKSLNVSISSISAAIVNALINLLFMEKYGIQVACISTLVGSIVIWIVRLIGLRNLVKIRIFNSTKVMFLLMVPFYFFQDIEGIIGNIVLIVIGGLIALIINFKAIIEIGGGMLKKIRSRD